MTEVMKIFSVRGDDIFEAERLPSYARTYILPRQMVRKSSKKSDPGPGPGEVGRAVVEEDEGQAGRKQSVVNTDFQFSMLKASLDYDTEVTSKLSIILCHKMCFLDFRIERVSTRHREQSSVPEHLKLRCQ